MARLHQLHIIIQLSVKPYILTYYLSDHFSVWPQRSYILPRPWQVNMEYIFISNFWISNEHDLLTNNALCGLSFHVGRDIDQKNLRTGYSSGFSNRHGRSSGKMNVTVLVLRLLCYRVRDVVEKFTVNLVKPIFRNNEFDWL